MPRLFTQYLENLKQSSKGDLNAKASDRGRERGRDGRDRGRDGRNDRGRRDSTRREDKFSKNDRFERRKDRDDKRGSHEENMDRFYVSIGRDDELQKADVLKIICDASGVRSRFIGKIQMFGKHTLVDVDRAKSGGFPNAFDGLRFNGRKLKVSLDNPS